MAAEATPGAFSMASGEPNPNTVPFSKTVFYTPDGNALEVNEEEMKDAMKYRGGRG